MQSSTRANKTESVAYGRDPSHAELASLRRDLRFYSVNNSQPKALSREQIGQFNRDGYIGRLPLYNDLEIKKIQEFVEHVQQREIASGSDPNFIRFVHLKYATGWDILTNPRIVAYVRDLLGEKVIGWGTAFFIKPPMNSSTVAFHQDASYWPLSPSKAVTVWLAIDDADVENAAMQFIAGSHHFGAATFRTSSPDEHNILDQTIDNPERYGTIVDNILKAGEASIHSDLLLHGSGPNTCERRRCGLTLRYAAAEVRASHDWAKRGVWVSGRDDSAHWSNNPRPPSD
jgi:ectoine hydroxylase-related dioxygenase (phytanoyl-CoA dioxygenase family)